MDTIYGHRFDNYRIDIHPELMAESAKEVFDKIITAISNFIKNIISFIKKLLGMNPNEKNKKNLNTNLNKAEDLYKNIKDTNNKEPEEIKNIKKKAEDINKSTENIAKDMEKENNSEDGFKKFEYDEPEDDELDQEELDYQKKLEKEKSDWIKITKFCQDTITDMQNSFDNIEKSVKEMRKDPENAEFLDELRNILDS